MTGTRRPVGVEGEELRIRGAERRLLDLEIVHAVKIHTPTLTNSWVNYGSIYQTPRAIKVGRLIILEGLIKNGSMGLAAFTLPVGWRPAAAHTFAVDQSSTNNTGRLDVNSSGQVIPTAGGTTHFSLGGAVFLAA